MTTNWTIVCSVSLQCYPEVAVQCGSIPSSLKQPEAWSCQWYLGCWLGNFSLFSFVSFALPVVSCVAVFKSFYLFSFVRVFFSLPLISRVAVLKSFHLVVFGVFTCAHVQYTIEASCPMTGLTRSTTARLNSGFLHQQNNNGICYYRGWESHRSLGANVIIFITNI
jgi:hypothetical protein